MPSSLLLRGGIVWDGTGTAPVRQDLALADGRVVAEPHADAEVLDCAGRFVMPGMVEAHAHLCFNAGQDWRETLDQETPESLLLRMAGNAQAMLAAGITTVRDLGAPTGAAVALRNAIETGRIAGPRLLVAGAPITPTGGHCWFLGGEADTVDDLRRMVRSHHRAGVDCIKVMVTGGMMTPGTNPLRPQYGPAELGTIVAEARRLGLPLAAHCHGTEGIALAAAAGFDTIEHCSFQGSIDALGETEVIEAVGRAGCAVSPTISPAFRRLFPGDALRARGALYLTLRDAGARLIVSTDCGIPGVPHDALGPAALVMAEATGLPPVDVLPMVTREAALAVGTPDRGVLVPGAAADVLVLDGDPLQDLRALEAVAMVICQGQVVRQLATPWRTGPLPSGR